MENFKEIINSLLVDLKKMGKSRRLIESELGYKRFYIDQVLSRGGNKTLLHKLDSYKSRLEMQQNVATESEAEYLKPKELIEMQQAYINELRAEKLKYIEEKKSLLERIARLEKTIDHLLTDGNFSKPTSGKRRSA